MKLEAISRIIATARAEGRRVLLETEGLDLLDALGITHPRYHFVHNASEARALDGARVPGDRVVVKVVSPTILHKSDVGGVVVVANDPARIGSAIGDMTSGLEDHPIVGFLVMEFIEHDASFGGELLAGLRWTDEFGAVITIGSGGITTEFLSRELRTGSEALMFSPALAVTALDARLQQVAAVRIATMAFRGKAARASVHQVAAVANHLAAVARAFMPNDIAECEINPLVTTSRGLVALDILVTLATDVPSVRPPRPIAKLDRLLHPRRAGIIGVSTQLNPGHIILNNLLRDGFSRDHIAIVKPGLSEIEGCACYPDVASIPARVDLFVLAVSAAQVPEVLHDIVRHEKAESVIVIPGGLEEKEGTAEITARMRAALLDSRNTEWRGPIINGGNCLGIRSRPGRYDTMFIPDHKMPPARGPVSRLAVVAQSGAFAVSRASRMSLLNPRYIISLGNQMDLTVGDYLTFLKDDPHLDVFAVYIEGFTPGDGLRCLEVAREIVSSGRKVILYRAGRTAAGAKATASHTASIAGDYRITRALAEQAGIVVAESLDDFDDLVRVFTMLAGSEPAGTRVAALSNAGFESVAIADNLGELELVGFSDSTRSQLAEIFRAARIDGLVDIHNPLDLTPMADDAAYENVVRAIMADEDVDVGVIGCVPMTGALQTLAPSPRHREDIGSSESLVSRLVKLRGEITKPWVAVVDAGELYDAMATALELGGIPTFRTADRALRILRLFCAARPDHCNRAPQEVGSRAQSD
jgi:acyl-CoA synthetase (NDP forming)